MDPVRLRRIADVFARAIAAGQLPGGVALIARQGKVVYEEAFGHRALVPEREAATPDTIYDLASLTKPVATGTAILQLAEQGLLSLSDPVEIHLPEWRPRPSMGKVRLSHLLTHTSGLAPFERYDVRRPSGDIRRIMLEDIGSRPLEAPPGSRFIYSDLGFIALGEIVERVTALPLNEYCRREIFAPLGMRDTGYSPDAESLPRIAPTEYRPDPTDVEEALKGESPRDLRQVMTRGIVHDPNTALRGGVSGHAGLFGTARDLARYCQMMLNGGEYQGARILSPTAVRAMTSEQTSLPDGTRRGYGWDLRSSFSHQRGDLFQSGYGHTGFTGTSIWIVPEEQLLMILLTNRVHPDGQGDPAPLRSRVANVVAAALRTIGN